MSSFSPNSHYSQIWWKDPVFLTRSSLAGLLGVGGSFYLFVVKKSFIVDFYSLLFIEMASFVFMFMLCYAIFFFARANEPGIVFFSDETFLLNKKIYPLSDLKRVKIKHVAGGRVSSSIFHNLLLLQLGIDDKKFSRVYLNFMSENFIPDFEMLDNLGYVLSFLQENSANGNVRKDCEASLLVLNHLRLERTDLLNENSVIEYFEYDFVVPDHLKSSDSVQVFENYIDTINGSR